MPFERAILLECDAQLRAALTARLRSWNLPVLISSTGAQAIKELNRQSHDVLVVALDSPGALDLLSQVRQMDLGCEVVLLAHLTNIPLLYEAARFKGANWVLKPFDLSQFDVALSHASSRRAVSSGVRHHALTSASPVVENGPVVELPPEILFKSAQMAKLMQVIDRVAGTNACVLIHGEAGSGKTLLALEIHRRSQRGRGPFVVVNCERTPEVVDREIFEHDGIGGGDPRSALEQAALGTLVLTHVGALSASAQARLVHLFQKQDLDRSRGAGGLQPNIRVLATTRVDLAHEVEKGTFRRDLFHRLDIIPLRLPPLRAREGGIAFLLHSFLQHFAQLHHRPVPAIGEAAMRQIESQPWPDNVRELREFAERAVLLTPDGEEIAAGEHFPPSSTASAPQSPVTATAANPAGVVPASGAFPTIAEMEKDLIRQALEKTDGQRNDAAKLLGINVRTLRNKLNSYEEQAKGVDAPPPTEPGDEPSI